MIALEEKVVYPGHGVARVNRIIEKKIGDKVAHFFELVFLHKDMMILVPVDNIEVVGLRKLSSEQSIDEIFAILSAPNDSTPIHLTVPSSWNKRSKKYQFKIKTGDIIEISKIYRDLIHISQHKELSFGERNLLMQTELLLAEEISLVKNKVEEQAVELLRGAFNWAKRSPLFRVTESQL
ncbi:MAG TPA: CarD family transcriptional regulator [Candidatus Babeliales bacterium]|nr:CarD family transcriptional regulator [Candidatus Babeliales bacterium]